MNEDCMHACAIKHIVTVDTVQEYSILTCKCELTGVSVGCHKEVGREVFSAVETFCSHFNTPFRILYRFKARFEQTMVLKRYMYMYSGTPLTATPE